MDALLAGPCSAAADLLSEQLGRFSCDAPAFVHFRNPAHLSNWTLPVLEALMLVGSGLALAHGVRRWRRAADPTPLVLWFASIVYVLVIEPPLYFPRAFHADGYLGTVFVHNVFTVDLLYDRLPLYIVALYTALPVLAFEIVRTLGLFRRGPVTGAACVGVVHSTFYEVFDHLGPQLRWWAWNTGNPMNRPFFSSVPLTSVTLFAAVGPAALVYLVHRLVGRPLASGARIDRTGYLWRTALAGALVPAAMSVAAIPSSVLGGHHPHVVARAVVLSLELAVMWWVAVRAVLGNRGSVSGVDGASPSRGFVLGFGAAYLAAFGVLWGTALPAFVDARHGVTSDHTPVGNLAFAAASYLAAVGWLVAAARAGGRTGQRPGAGRAMASPATRR
jgi:hypothetical protein